MAQNEVDVVDQRKDDYNILLRKVLLRMDIAFHAVAALLLLIACGIILYNSFLYIINPSVDSMIHLINDVLLALIVLELLWTVIRFLRKQQFTLGPFLSIGVIAAVRRILLIEAQTSSMTHVPIDKLYEMGLSAFVVAVLVVSYYLSVKAQNLEKDED